MTRLKVSKDEKKNGWTEEALRVYIAQREAAQADIVLPDEKPIRFLGLESYDAKKDF